MPSFCLSDLQIFLGLQRQVPLGMLLDVVNALEDYLAVTHLVAGVAGLQAQIRVAADVAVQLRVVNAVEDDLHLVDLVGNEPDLLVNKAVLRRDGHPVDVLGDSTRAVGLHRHEETLLMEFVHQLLVDLQRRLSACEHHEGAVFPLSDFVEDVGGGHERMTGVVGVAEGAVEVAAAEADEDGCAPCVASLALQGIKYFVDTVLLFHILFCSTLSVGQRR